MESHNLGVMKPSHIFLVRHAQSDANLDNEVYFTTPDWKINLSEEGVHQAHRLGKQINERLMGSIDFYCSPYIRARQTCDVISMYYKRGKQTRVYDPRLRERDWSSYITPRDSDVPREMIYEFDYRFPGGESAADVYNRLSSFFIELYMKPVHGNVVIVSHGATILVSLIKLLGLDPEEYRTMSLPDNGEVYKLKLDGDKYILENQYKLDD